MKLSTLKENAKSVIASMTALSAWGTTAAAENGITGAEWFGLLGVPVAGLTVWAATNAPTEHELTDLGATLDEAKRVGAIEEKARGTEAAMRLIAMDPRRRTRPLTADDVPEPEEEAG